MKRILLGIALCLVAVLTVSAQSVNFKLSPDGTVKTADAKDFVRVDYKGKTATEIFQIIFNNAGAAYKSSKQKVIFTLDGESLSIRANETDLTFQNEGTMFSGYYTLKFVVKDGALKVESPKLDAVLTNKETGVREKDFNKLVMSWYVDGKLQAKYNAQASFTEKKLNTIVNSVLQGKSLSADSEW